MTAHAQTLDKMLPVSDFTSMWSLIAKELQTALGASVYQSWIAPLSACEFQAGVFILSTPTRFMRDWIHSNYLDVITSTAQQLFPNIIKIDIIVSAFEPAPLKVALSNDQENNDDDAPVRSIEDISSKLDPRLTFDNFVVGKPNELAYAAALRVAEATKVAYNPLFLYGGVGLGKTHLMHAIGWHIKKMHPKKKVLYISAEKFMYQFIRALRFHDTVTFKEQFRGVDVLMIDDVQFISGKDSTQEEFFHTFNALVDKNHQVIISADKSPSDLEGMEERLKSRLGWGLVADIHPTSYELRLGILQAKAALMDVIISDKVLEFLAHKISSNVRELEGALTRVVAHGTLVGREITLELTQEILRDLIRANDRRVNMDDIQRKVAEHFNVRLSDLQSSKRTRAIARPRQIAMYLCKQLTTKSLPEIGRKFGGRDHTTVLHAVKKINELLESDPSITEDVELLRRALII